MIDCAAATQTNGVAEIFYALMNAWILGTRSATLRNEPRLIARWLSKPNQRSTWFNPWQDVFSRRVVGWAMASHLRTELVIGALEMAVAQRRPDAVVHHSDQGCQCTSPAFGARCRKRGVALSMGSVGDCFDNALAERFFATLECETARLPGRRISTGATTIATRFRATCSVSLGCRTVSRVRWAEARAAWWSILRMPT